jgi:hypothetical protein
MLFKIDPINFSHERSEPLAAYRARIAPYNPLAFPPSMEVSVGCNPSRPTIYSPSRHCRFQSNIFLMMAESRLLRGVTPCLVNLYQLSQLALAYWLGPYSLFSFTGGI